MKSAVYVTVASMPASASRHESLVLKPSRNEHRVRNVRRASGRPV